MPEKAIKIDVELLEQVSKIVITVMFVLSMLLNGVMN
jgi:hypothetical protein